MTLLRWLGLAVGAVVVIRVLDLLLAPLLMPLVGITVVVGLIVWAVGGPGGLGRR